jgi:hypothetical protein
MTLKLRNSDSASAADVFLGHDLLLFVIRIIRRFTHG